MSPARREREVSCIRLVGRWQWRSPTQGSPYPSTDTIVEDRNHIRTWALHLLFGVFAFEFACDRRGH